MFNFLPAKHEKAEEDNDFEDDELDLSDAMADDDYRIGLLRHNNPFSSPRDYWRLIR
jgi:hypothetical protein